MHVVDYYRVIVSTSRTWQAPRDLEGQPGNGGGFVVDIDVCSRIFDYFDTVAF